MALDHEAILDQKYAPLVHAACLAVISNDLPSFARPCRYMGMAKGAHVVAASFVVVCQRQSSLGLEVAGVDAKELVGGWMWLRMMRVRVRLDGDCSWTFGAVWTFTSLSIP